MLQRVNYVTRQSFKKQNYVIKAVKVVLEQFKLAKKSCNIQEQLIPCRYLCLSKLFRPIMVSFTLHFQLHLIKSLKFC